MYFLQLKANNLTLDKNFSVYTLLPHASCKLNSSLKDAGAPFNPTEKSFVWPSGKLSHWVLPHMSGSTR